MKKRSLLTGLLSALVAPALWAQNNIQDLLPLQKGYVVATCHSSTSFASTAQNPNGFVVGLIDGSTSELALAPTDVAGGGYPWRKFHNEVSVQNPGVPDPLQEWTAGNLGEVYGITLDDENPPNIYVSATATYGNYPVPAGNSKGTVYKLDGATGDITPYNCIPAGNPSLGNLTHWRADSGDSHLYVSNLDDGLIYQLDSAGACVGTYDHGLNGRPAASPPLAAIPDTAAAYTPLGRRIWGLEAHGGRLYYGVWNAINTHTVWSVALDAAGAPDASTAQLEIPVVPGKHAISDIAFSQDGRLFLAQRYHRGAGSPFIGTHDGNVLEFIFDGTNWIVSPIDKFKTGNYSQGDNSAGGVALECSGAVWASGDALNYPAPYLYGVTRIPAGGNQADSPHAANSHIVDLDGIINGVPKTWIGDVEVFDTCLQCIEVTDIEIDCPREPGAPYTVTYSLTNLSENTAAYLWHLPCPEEDLPDGAITGSLIQTGLQELPAPLPSGESTTVTVDIPAPMSGGIFCWNMVLLDETGGECCSEKYCVTLPDCECFIVRNKEINCVVDAAGAIKYTVDLELQNTSTFAWEHLNLLPPSLFTDASFDLSGAPVPVGGTYTVSTCISGNPGDLVCFNIAVHSAGAVECCSKECCILLPPCDGVEPDHCAVTRRAPCCPDAQGNTYANITLTVCNNSAFPRTYSWGINGLAPTADCPGFLPPGSFPVPGGSIVVGPNACETIAIQIDCKELVNANEACYEVCVRQDDDPDNTFCCRGLVFIPEPGGPVVKADQNVVDLNSPNNSLSVTNSSNEPRDIQLEIISRNTAVDLSSPAADTKGFSPMLRVSLRVAPGETQKIDLQLRENANTRSLGRTHQVFVDSIDDEGHIQNTVASFVALVSRPTAAAPIIQSVSRSSNGDLTLVVGSKIGQRYQIQASHSIGKNNDWQPISCHARNTPQPATEFTATGSELQLTLSPNADCPANFYRAVELED